MSSTNMFVFLVICFSFVYCEEKYKQIDIEIKLNPGGEAPRIFTAEELAKYDATDPDLPIYLAVRGTVFDVTSGKAFYVKQSEYNVLTGKDASRAHATWSLKEKDLIHDLTGLDDDQLKGLDDVYTMTYMAKYPVVGYMDWLVKEQGKDFPKRFTNNEEL